LIAECFRAGAYVDVYAMARLRLTAFETTATAIA
jgi:hypothetical protein